LLLFFKLLVLFRVNIVKNEVLLTVFITNYTIFLVLFFMVAAGQWKLMRMKLVY